MGLQSLLYQPDLSHDGRNLFCIYNQTDPTGSPIFPNPSEMRDELGLSIHFLQDPQAVPLIMSEAKASAMRHVDRFKFGESLKGASTIFTISGWPGLPFGHCFWSQAYARRPGCAMDHEGAKC